MSRPTHMEISSGFCGDFITKTYRLGLRCPDRAARVVQETHNTPPAHPRPGVRPHRGLLGWPTGRTACGGGAGQPVATGAMIGTPARTPGPRAAWSLSAYRRDCAMIYTFGDYELDTTLYEL